MNGPLATGSTRRPGFRNPRIFVSYAHEPGITGHKERALDLAQSLRLKGIDANIDQFVEHDPPTWPRWMLDEVRGADFVLCLASPLYKQRTQGSGDPFEGRGARWEGAIITEELYAQFPGSQAKFIATILHGCSAEDIPDVLLPVGRTYYRWPEDEESLYRRLTGQPRVIPIPLGQIVDMGSNVSEMRRGLDDHTAVVRGHPAGRDADAISPDVTRRARSLSRDLANYHTNAESLYYIGTTLVACDALFEVLGIKGEPVELVEELMRKLDEDARKEEGMFDPVLPVSKIARLRRIIAAIAPSD